MKTHAMTSSGAPERLRGDEPSEVTERSPSHDCCILRGPCFERDGPFCGRDVVDIVVEEMREVPATV